jgi:hypothetical protein
MSKQTETEKLPEEALDKVTGGKVDTESLVMVEAPSKIIIKPDLPSNMSIPTKP